LNDSSGDNYLAVAERTDRDRNVSNVSGLSALSHKSAPERERSTGTTYNTYISYLKDSYFNDSYCSNNYCSNCRLVHTLMHCALRTFLIAPLTLLHYCTTALLLSALICYILCSLLLSAATADMHTHQHHHIDAGFRPDRDVVSDLRDIERERERSDRVTSTLSMLSMASSGSLTRGATPPLVGSSGGVALGLAGYSLGGTLSVPASAGLYGHALLLQQQQQAAQQQQQQSLSERRLSTQAQQHKQQRRGSGSAIGHTSTWGTSPAAASSSSSGTAAGTAAAGGSSSGTGSGTGSATDTTAATGGVDDDDFATSSVLVTTDKVTRPT
jgi:hypothetical protein